MKAGSRTDILLLCTNQKEGHKILMILQHNKAAGFAATFARR